jgi:hypothetical protein
MALATVELEKTGARAQRLIFPTPNFCVDKALPRYFRKIRPHLTNWAEKFNELEE